jgi:hypothetical protein
MNNNLHNVMTYVAIALVLFGVLKFVPATESPGFLVRTVFFKSKSFLWVILGLCFALFTKLLGYRILN